MKSHAKTLLHASIFFSILLYSEVESMSNTLIGISEINKHRDIGVTTVLRETLPDSIMPVFEVLALLGDLWVVLAVIGIVWLTDVYRGVSNIDQAELCTDRTGYFIGIVIGGLALAVVLKAVFALPRPPTALQATPRAGFGFPSGHTMAAAVVWTSLALWSHIGVRRIRVLGAGVIIGLVALSRLALGVHYLVDVVASIGFGIGYLILAAWLTGRDPLLMFSSAIGIGILAFIVSEASRDGQLALVGTVGTALGWWALKRLSTRKWIHEHVY